MNRAKLDVLWQQAMRASIAEGEQFTRYHFAKLVTDAEAHDNADMLTIAHMDGHARGRDSERRLLEAEKKRADALAATINGILNITTTDAEGKADFVKRVNAILSQCPDARVLHAVEAEREACAKLADDYATWGGSNFFNWFKRLSSAIRARGQQ